MDKRSQRLTQLLGKKPALLWLLFLTALTFLIVLIILQIIFKVDLTSYALIAFLITSVVFGYAGHFINPKKTKQNIQTIDKKEVKIKIGKQF